MGERCHFYHDDSLIVSSPSLSPLTSPASPKKTQILADAKLLLSKVQGKAAQNQAVQQAVDRVINPSKSSANRLTEYISQSRLQRAVAGSSSPATAVVSSSVSLSRGLLAATPIQDAGSQNICCLDVGGARFMCSRVILDQVPTSLLARQARVSAPTFFDRDPTHFGLLLNYLRDGDDVVLPFHDTFQTAQLRKEALHFEIAGLVGLIDRKAPAPAPTGKSSADRKALGLFIEFLNLPSARILTSTVRRALVVKAIEGDVTLLKSLEHCGGIKRLPSGDPGFKSMPSDEYFTLIMEAVAEHPSGLERKY